MLTLIRRGLAVRRQRTAGAIRDLGASALEWAVISAIVITAAVVIGGVVMNVVNSKTDKLNNCGTYDAKSTAAPANC